MKEIVPKKPTDIVTEKDLEAAKAPPKLPSEIGIPEGTKEFTLGDKDTSGQEVEGKTHRRYEGESKVFCPLCHRHFERWFSEGRKEIVLICEVCRIGIRERDPLLGLWDKVMEKLDPEMLACPVCGSKMRFFCTSLRFMKAKCPALKCGASMVLSEPDRDAPPEKKSILLKQ